MFKVVPGRLLVVHNKNKKRFAAANYHAVWVEDADGDNERCLLLTSRELRIAEERAAKNQEDIPRKNVLVDLID
jgi:hypothetical protein